MTIDGYGFEGAEAPAAGGGGAVGGVGEGVAGPLFITSTISANAQLKPVRRREKELISVATKLLLATDESAAQRRKYHQADNLSTTEHVLECVFTSTFGNLHASGMDIFSTHTTHQTRCGATHLLFNYFSCEGH